MPDSLLHPLKGLPSIEGTEGERLEFLYPLAKALCDLAAGGEQTRETLTPLVDEAYGKTFRGWRLADTAAVVARLIVDADPRFNVEAMVCTIAARFIAAESCR